MSAICTILGVTPVKVWAVLVVVTHGFGFIKNRWPQILFEAISFINLRRVGAMSAMVKLRWLYRR